MSVQIVQAAIAGVTASAAVAATIIGFWNWGKARKNRKSEFLGAYLKEYRQGDMGKAIRDLWKLWEDCGYDRNALIARYVKDAKDADWHLHFDVRRKVSAFYQEMGFLAQQDHDMMDMLLDVWGAGDLRLIKEVLLPIEREAIPQLFGQRPPDDGKLIETNDSWPRSFVAMANLYNEALRRESSPKTKKRKARPQSS